MPGFAAILLICLNQTPSDQCNEQTAVDVLSVHVDNELGCTQGWQDLAGRYAAGQEIGTKTYIRTLCLREGPAIDKKGGE